MQNFNPLVALGLGILAGWAGQLIVSRLRHNGEWDEISIGKKTAMSATGAFAALLVGLWVLDHPPADPAAPYVFRLWMWQAAAGWSGSFLLDAVSFVLVSFVKRGPDG